MTLNEEKKTDATLTEILLYLKSGHLQRTSVCLLWANSGHFCSAGSHRNYWKEQRKIGANGGERSRQFRP
jgi:hypothetical protein